MFPNRWSTPPTSNTHETQNSMVPNQAPQKDTEKITHKLPPLTSTSNLPPFNPRASDRNLLTPEDAFHQSPPRRQQSAAVNSLQQQLRMTSVQNGDVRLRRTHKDGNRSSSRRRGTWKKLLWVKQSCTSYRSLRDIRSNEQQIRIITQIKIPSSSTSSETPASNPTISGPW